MIQSFRHLKLQYLSTGDDFIDNNGIIFLVPFLATKEEEEEEEEEEEQEQEQEKEERNLIHIKEDYMLVASQES